MFLIPTATSLPRGKMMQHSLDLPTMRPESPVARYLHLTETVMPTLALQEMRHWPVRNDHCFQRIVLDTLCNGVWYDHIARPARQHLDQAQAVAAVRLCEAIIAGEIDLTVLNRQSLAWRGKLTSGRS